MAQILADVFVNRSVAYCFSLTAPPRTAVVRMFATVQGANRAGGWDEPELKMPLLEELTDVDVATVSEALDVRGAGSFRMCASSSSAQASSA